MTKNCQVCGNPMFSMNDLGSNDDGTFNTDYCSNCYRNGEFTADRDNMNNSDGNFIGLPFPFAPINYGVSTQGYAPPIIIKNNQY